MTSRLSVTKVHRTLTWGNGQQAHSPEVFLQQVVPPGHMVCPSQFSFPTLIVKGESFFIQEIEGTKPKGSLQVWAFRLHVVS